MGRIHPPLTRPLTMLILPKLIPLLHPFLAATGTGSDPSFINPAPRL
jgi:hypothetical protein